MTTIVRRCPHCGSIDPSRSWTSFEAAADAGAAGGGWACPSCAWPESELVSADEPPAVPDGSLDLKERVRAQASIERPHPYG